MVDILAVDHKQSRANRKCDIVKCCQWLQTSWKLRSIACSAISPDLDFSVLNWHCGKLQLSLAVLKFMHIHIRKESSLLIAYRHINELRNGLMHTTYTNKTLKITVPVCLSTVEVNWLIGGGTFRRF